MTFGELREYTRLYIIADQYEDAYTNAQVNDALWLASVEAAAMLDIPRVVTTEVLAEGAQAFTLADARSILSLSIGGYNAISADLRQLSQLWDGGGNRPVKFFNFDPRRADQIVISPATPGGTAMVEYVQALTRPADLDFDATEVWGGLLSPYHALVAYKAGYELFRADERENEAEPLLMQFQTRLSEAAAFLSRTDVPNLVVAPEMRDDTGARG